MKQKFLKEVLKGTKIKILFIIAFSLVSSYLVTLIPLYTKYALDGIVYKNEVSIPSYISIFFWDTSLSTKLIVICIFLFGINVLKSLANFCRDRMVSKFKIQINKNVRRSVLSKTEKINYLNFMDIDKSKIIQRTNGDINTFTSFFDMELIMLFDLVFVIIFAVKNVLELNFEIGIYLIMCVCLLLIAAIIYFNKSKKLTEKTVRANEDLIINENNLIKNIKMIKMYNKENEEKEKFMLQNEMYNSQKKKMLDCTVAYHIFSHIINISSVPIVVTIGGVIITKGMLTFGDLAAILQYRGTILEKCSKLEQKYRDINQFYIAYKILKDFMNLPEDESGVTYNLNGNITFKDVTIYVEDNVILENLNFEIEEGKKYVLVGDNGTGKSILLKTILGLYKYTGEILVGDKNLKQLNSNTIIKNISIVNQEPYLFNASIRENITLGKSDNNITEVLKDAEISEDIVDFTKGYDTIVNENNTLSGGQKQRIAIARALYQNRNYLLLDDAFSKLDSITKNKILDHLKKILKTSIIATYDYQVIKNIDNVLFIDNKNVISSTNEKLRNENKSYTRLINVSRNKLGEEYE